MIYDVLILGGGAAGMSCALVLGSAQKKSYAIEKRVGIVIHQGSSAMKYALFNNVLGIKPGTTGESLLAQGKEQLKSLYPQIDQIAQEEVVSVLKEGDFIIVNTDKNSYKASTVVVAVEPSDQFDIDGLLPYVRSHSKLPAAKKRIQLQNDEHLITDRIYVAGVLAGHISQFAIACGSGAEVATKILSEWNNGKPTMAHDVIS